MPQPSPFDKELIRLGASYVNLRVRDFADLTGRSLHALGERMPKLVISHKTRFGEDKGKERLGVGYFKWLANPANPFEKVYFLTQKGWDRAHLLGFVNHEVSATEEKSEGQLEHDLILTDFHKALHFAFGDRLTWTQLWKNRYTRWGKGKDMYVNADAYFYLRQADGSYAAFFVEIENQKGVQEPLRKMEGYLRFANSGAYQEKFQHDDFRVILLKPTLDMALKVLNAAGKTKSLATGRFWISDYAAALAANAANYRTLKDSRLLSLSDA